MSDTLEFSGRVTGVVFAPAGIRMWMSADGEVANGQGDEVDVTTTVTVTGPSNFAFDPEAATPVAIHVAGRLLLPIRLSIRTDRTLIVQFGDGYEWSCAPHESFEAWTVAANGVRWISAPGGEVVVFSDSSPESSA